MDYSVTMTNWVKCLGTGEAAATERLFRDYFDRLISLAVHKMHGLNQVSRSGEDIALSAVNSLCMGLRENRIELNTEEDLWGCLFCITMRKVTAERRRAYAEKRGRNQKILEGDAVIGNDDDMTIFDMVAGSEPSPELALQMAEEADSLLALFKGRSPQEEIVSLKLQGLSVPEIAERTGLVARTVFWHLGKIREKWEFFKSMEHLINRLFEGSSVARIASQLNRSEGLVLELVDCMFALWGEELQKGKISPTGIIDLLRLKLLEPEKFEEVLQKCDPMAVELEKNAPKLADMWGRHAQQEWRNKLQKIWQKENE
ncbi:MAG: ECF-type sigma factor [Planctomycetia bacterium]|nr:ECF-type sigma factor [Planctomycetia bacterium]